MIRDTILAEFDQEMASTRRLLERVPETAFGWKPHEKSYALGGLATHLAQIPRWGLTILRRDRYDMNEADAKPAAKDLATIAEVLRLFDDHAGQVRRELAEASDAPLSAPWTLTRGPQTILSMPRGEAFRRFVVSHTVHHRGQLTVYLRLQDVPLPPVYGPSADERM
jgi:uncharacterized damage-inducible protein DinB